MTTSYYRSLFRVCLTLGVFAAMVACTITKSDIGIDEGGNGGGGKPGDGVISIAALKALYVNRPRIINEEISIEGQVISSDAEGNFYKSLYLQDNSGGIAVRLDMEEYYLSLPYGSYVRIYCNSLALGSYGGAVYLGVLSGNEVVRIPADYVGSTISVVSDVEEGDFQVLTIPQIGPGHIGRLVFLQDVQFVDGVGAVSWVDDQKDTSRRITDREGNEIDVRTSGYAEFGDALLPSGSGYIKAIAGYFNGNYQLTISYRSDVSMTGERFDVPW